MQSKVTNFLAVSLASTLFAFENIEAQELPPAAIFVEQPYIFNEGGLFNNALYIHNFKCLVKGLNVQREEACDYYQAIISETSQPLASSQTICFKESTRVFYPRQYLPDERYRLVYYSEKTREHLYPDELYHSYATQRPKMEPYPIGRIISQTPMPNKDSELHTSIGFQSGRKVWEGLPRHHITDIVIYDCSTPYDGKSYN